MIICIPLPTMLCPFQFCFESVCVCYFSFSFFFFSFPLLGLAVTSLCQRRRADGIRGTRRKVFKKAVSSRVNSGGREGRDCPSLRLRRRGAGVEMGSEARGLDPRLPQESGWGSAHGAEVFEARLG